MRAKHGERGETADVVMAEGEATGSRVAVPVVEERRPTELSEAELRALLRNPRMVVAVRRLVAETGAEGGGGIPESARASAVVFPAREASLRAGSEGNSDSVVEKGTSASPNTEKEGGVTPGEPREVLPEEEVGDYVQEVSPCTRHCTPRCARHDLEHACDSPSVTESLDTKPRACELFSLVPRKWGSRS